LGASGSNYANFIVPKKVVASGNVQSLLNWSSTCPERSFHGLFRSCRSLIDVAQLYLSAVYLGAFCYARMFESTGFSKQPIFSSNIASVNFYSFGFMFTQSYLEEFIAPTNILSTNSYDSLLSSSRVKSIRVGFTNWASAELATQDWVNGVSPTGTFYKPSALPEEYGASRIPEGWTVVNID
jgi:hypothetical protein